MIQSLSLRLELNYILLFGGCAGNYARPQAHRYLEGEYIVIQETHIIEKKTDKVEDR
jgi:hypothetical protein